MNESESTPKRETNPDAGADDAQLTSVSGSLQRDALLAKRKRSGRNRLLIVLLSLPLVIALTGLAIGTTRAVDVLVQPAAAGDAASVELEQGFGAVISGKLYLLGSAGRVKVSSPTYVPVTIDVQPGSNGRYVEVELMPQPARVNFELVGDYDHLAETRWLLNGALVETGPALSQELAADEYELSVDHPFYELDERQLLLARGEELDQQIELTPVQGVLSLASSPSGAEVFLNGEPVGQSDLQLSRVGGEYEVRLRLPDHGSVSERVTLNRAQRSVERDYRLLVNAANLAVKVSPADGALLLNGRAVTPDRELTLGARTEHVVTYEKPGFHTATHRVTLAPGERQQILLELRANIGDVRVQSEPVAEVTVNGRVVGNSPVALQLPAVPHTVTLTKPGYHTETRTILPSDSAQKLVKLTLKTELDYRLQNMPREFSTSAGIPLLRFQPNEQFEIGAPRSELGQRANEIERRVQLDKAFYVAKTEITNAQFAPFASATGIGSQANNGNHPRTGVSWDQAAAYCNWLSAREGLTPVYQFSGSRFVSSNLAADGYRLPTEAEWEWLARKAGRRTATRFTWGDEYQVPRGSGNLADETARAQVAQFVAQYTDGFAGVAPVGSFGADAAGLHDMSGNVSEWVHDFYQITPATNQQEARNPAGPTFGEGHVVKGSSWRSGTPTTLRAAYREPGSGGRDDLGFRVVRYVYGAQ